MLVAVGYMPVGCTEFAKRERRDLYKLGDVGTVKPLTTAGDAGTADRFAIS